MFPIIRGTLLGVPITRIIVFWGLYWGPLVLGNCHFLPQVAEGLLGLGLQCSNRNNRNVIDNDHGTTNLNHGDKEDKHKQG